MCCGIVNIRYKQSGTADRALTNKIPERGVNRANIEEDRAILEQENLQRNVWIAGVPYLKMLDGCMYNSFILSPMNNRA